MKISKILSLNDVGSTGSHQAGMHIPKDPQIIAFFPALNNNIKNPRCEIYAMDVSSNKMWKFNFIYYNNKFFGGTRNEYRLTGMTQFLKTNNAKENDTILLEQNERAKFQITLKRKDTTPNSENPVITLSTTWKIIKK
jgi:hypothetical protein